jgi:Terpene synthase family 2, C-terminal metal binding
MPLTPKRDRAAREVDEQTAAAKDSPWGGLRSRFLASLDPAEQVRIFDLSARTSQTLHRWAARYPLIRRVRVWPLSLSVAAGAPFTSVEALISTARLSLWVFTLDDLFDEERVPQAELTKRAERYRGLAHREIPCLAGDSLATALCELRDDLARYPLFGLLGSEWANALCGTIDGMMREYQWRLAYRKGTDDRATLPSYAEYVATGRYSIGGPPHIWAALITSDDPSTPAHLDHLRAMEQLASTCIRLANDLQSYQKEVDEGKINALVILSRELRAQGVPEAEAYKQAEARVHADIVAGLDQLTTLREKSVTQTGRPEAAIDNIARFVCDFYTHHDYHTFLAQAA